MWTSICWGSLSDSLRFTTVVTPFLWRITFKRDNVSIYNKPENQDEDMLQERFGQNDMKRECRTFVTKWTNKLTCLSRSTRRLPPHQWWTHLSHFSDPLSSLARSHLRVNTEHVSNVANGWNRLPQITLECFWTLKPSGRMGWLDWKSKC